MLATFLLWEPGSQLERGAFVGFGLAFEAGQRLPVIQQLKDLKQSVAHYLLIDVLLCAL